MRHHRYPLILVRLWLLPAAALLALGAAGLALAFAEEPLAFRDPATGQLTDDQISTIHFDLTYAQALASGFTITDSVRLQVWDQLVDSEQLGPGDTAAYSNCLGSFNPTPDPKLVCGPGVDTAIVAWPRWEDMQDTASCAASRFGPYSPFFRFLHMSQQELGALHD